MKLLTLSMMLLTAFSWHSLAKTIKVGDVYDIKERPMQELIADKIQNGDYEQRLRNYTKSFETGIEVPVATIEREFTFTPWHTLKHPIRDQNNQVLFPAGFRFNPLSKVTAPGRLIFFNEDQLEWVQTQLQPGDQLVLTAGDVFQARSRLRQIVFLLDTQTHQRLQVNTVPRIYEQRNDDQHFTVNEYAL